MPQPSLPQPIDVPVHLSWANFRDFHWKLATAQSTLLHPLLSVKTFEPCRRLWRSATQQSRVMAPLRTLGSRLAWQLKTTQLHATKCKTEKHEKHEGTLDKANSEICSEYVCNESFICRYVRWYRLKSLKVLCWRGVVLGIWGVFYVVPFRWKIKFKYVISVRPATNIYKPIWSNLQVGASFQCAECRQKFDSEKVGYAAGCYVVWGRCLLSWVFVCDVNLKASMNKA